MTHHLLANLIRDKHRRKAEALGDTRYFGQSEDDALVIDRYVSYGNTRLMTLDELQTATERSETLSEFDSHLERAIRRLTRD